MGGIIGAAAFDYLRCGLRPPEATSLISTGDKPNKAPEDASGPTKQQVHKAIAEANGKCLARKCGYLYSTTDLPTKYNKCIVFEAVGECKQTN